MTTILDMGKLTNSVEVVNDDHGPHKHLKVMIGLNPFDYSTTSFTKVRRIRVPEENIHQVTDVLEDLLNCAMNTGANAVQEQVRLAELERKNALERGW